MKIQLAVGVRELVEHVLRSGDLVMEFTGSSRAAEAVRIHQRIQYSRPDGYMPEVSVSRRVETDDFVLVIGGRIDGVFTGPGTPVVEEIKTTRRSLEESVRSENPLHWGQAKAYAFLYGVDRGLGDIEVQLTYARLDTGATREVRRRFTLAELAAFFFRTGGVLSQMGLRHHPVAPAA
jgi:DNA excision repair protein ERCC-2